MSAAMIKRSTYNKVRKLLKKELAVAVSGSLVLSQQVQRLQDTLQRERSLHETELREARRRTISYGDGEINFLPLAINSIEITHDIREAQGMAGFYTKFMHGPARAVIVCDGATVQFTPYVKKG